MADNFHNKRFEKGTLVKLELLRKYISSWLPVFIEAKNPYWDEIYLYDFFAGTGMDSDGNYGSPLIILDELRKYCPKILNKKLKVNILVNEANKKKLNLLKKKISEYIDNCREKQEFTCCSYCQSDEDCPFQIKYKEKKFQDLFYEIYPSIVKTGNLPRFMFIDQYGIKEITHDIFKKLTNLSRTDFLFFISSSFIQRFAELESFQNYLKVNSQTFDKSEPEHCHRVILKYYQQQITNKDYYLAPFSIKKKQNIYGLIFGSNNPLGLEKFLSAAWSIDKNTGEANFNIDSDRILETKQLSFFPEDNKIKKIDIFEKNMKEWLKKSPRTNKEIYLFALTNGMLIKHANEVLKKIKDKITVDSEDKIKRGSFYLGYNPKKQITVNYNE